MTLLLIRLNLEMMDESEEFSSTAVIDKVKTPPKFKVILWNDDFTPMDFVVYVLQRFFSRSIQEAEKIMLDVHNQGAGIAGVYSQEVAEMKVDQVSAFVRQNKHPLKVTLEEE